MMLRATEKEKEEDEEVWMCVS